MVSGGGDALISVWDLNAVTCVRTMTRMDGPVKDLSISRDGQYVAYASEQLANLETGNATHKGFVEILSMATGESMMSFSAK
jgi:THO complex subunit 3